ncbi:YdcH family protein [Fretibacter rubidus]|uniref:YdcH family protein n=1 Tax=Fretibacter rubidus TaxID=570162 RepID=UPI00352AF780
MSAAAHVRELENKHAKLDDKIRTESKHPAADPAQIATLKKQKLMIKDQINALSDN